MPNDDRGGGGRPPLAGRRILVTGASSGIGAAVVEAAVARGARVAAVARRANRLTALADRHGDAVVACPGDVTDAAAMADAAGRAAEALGAIDALVTCAGMTLMTDLFDGDVTAWKHGLDLNVFGTLTALRASLAHFPAEGPRDVVIVGSTASVTPLDFLPVYGASKRALDGLADSARLQLAPKGIRVCAFRPGVVTTESRGKAIIDKAVAERYADTLSSMGRFDALEAHHAAEAVIFVLSQPEGMAVHELVVRPTGQLTP